MYFYNVEMFLVIEVFKLINGMWDPWACPYGRIWIWVLCSWGRAVSKKWIKVGPGPLPCSCQRACDVNPGNHNHRIKRYQGPWVDWGLRRGRHMIRNQMKMESDSKINFTIKMISKFNSTTTSVFVFERPSREYLERSNQSPREEVIAILRKLCNTERNARAGVLPTRKRPLGKKVSKLESAYSWEGLKRKACIILWDWGSICWSM